MIEKTIRIKRHTINLIAVAAYLIALSWLASESFLAAIIIIGLWVLTNYVADWIKSKKEAKHHDTQDYQP